MLILLSLFLIMCCYKMKFNFKSGEVFSDYLSIEKTTSIKGIFILLVFFSHYNKYVEYSHFSDIAYFKIIGVIGQIMVVPFLFYSGYGVLESIKKKGTSYVNAFPKNRIIKVWLEFGIAVSVLMLVKYICGYKFTAPKVLSTYAGLENDWFVLAIICLYLFTFLSFKFIKGRNYMVNIGVIFALTLIYIFILRNFRSRFYYDTVLSYSAGMLWSLYKDKITKLISGKIYKWALACAILGALCVLMRVLGNHLPNVLLGYVITGAFIVVFTMRVSFNNKLLSWCGQHLFEIYLLHRIPMVICERTGLIEFNPYISFVICIVTTVALVWAFKRGYMWLWNRFDSIMSKKVVEE